MPEKITVEHDISVKSIEQYVEAFCKSKFDNTNLDPNIKSLYIQDCTKVEIGKLISMIGRL